MRFSDINLQPDNRMLRHFGLLWWCVFTLLAIYQGRDRAHLVFAIAITVIALLGGMCALLKPQWLKPIYVGWMIAAFPVGWLVSHLVLAFIYFGLFMPIGFILRCCGHDPLNLKNSPQQSYWQDKPATEDLRRYLRQY